MSRDGLIATIDVGATKAACLVARRGAGAREVAGVGFQESAAPLSDYDATVRLIRLALDDAESAAGTALPAVAAVYGGPGLRTIQAAGAVPISGSVDEGAVRRALGKAVAGAASREGRTLLHAAPLAYQVDRGGKIADPRGQKGRMLTAHVALTTAPTAALEALASCVEDAGARCAGFIAAPLALGHALFSDAERMAGAAALELGATGVTAAVFRGGALAHAEHLPFGQAKLTEFLAARLATTTAAAERVKRAFVSFDGGPAAELVEAPRLGPEGRLEAASVRRGDLMEIACGPLGETFAAVKQAIARGGGAKVVALAGGGATLSGLEAFAEAALGVPVRRDGAERLQPRLAAAYGALGFAGSLQGAARRSQAMGLKLDARGGASRAWAWLKENF